jgi:fibronectin-binding autotransporter adhesin
MQPTMSSVTAIGNNQAGSAQIITGLAYVTGGTGTGFLDITGIVANGTTWVVTYTPDAYNVSGSYASGSVTIAGVSPATFNGTFTIASGTGSTFTITNATAGTYVSGGTIPAKINNYNGVALPPAMSGRTVNIINKSANPVYIYPGKSAAGAAGSSSSGSTTITVSSTATLLPGMVVSVSSGTGAFVLGTKIVSILTSTTFVVDKAPATALSGATITINGGTSSSINGLPANQGYLVLDGTSITMMATSSTEWFTSSAASMGSNNGVAGTYQANDIIYAIDAANLGGINAAAVGNVLLSNGTAAAPSYGKVNLASMITGILPIANGGTGSNGTSLTGSTSYALLNTGTTSINFGGAATAITIGTVGGMTTVSSE